MTGETCIAGPFPTSIGQELYRQYHFPEMMKIVFRLIEQAMSQACSDEDAEKAVKEQRFKLVIADFFVSLLVADYEIGTGDTDDP